MPLLLLSIPLPQCPSRSLPPVPRLSRSSWMIAWLALFYRHATRVDVPPTASSAKNNTATVCTCRCSDMLMDLFGKGKQRPFFSLFFSGTFNWKHRHFESGISSSTRARQCHIVANRLTVHPPISSRLSEDLACSCRKLCLFNENRWICGVFFWKEVAFLRILQKRGL